MNEEREYVPAVLTTEQIVKLRKLEDIGMYDNVEVKRSNMGREIHICYGFKHATHSLSKENYQILKTKALDQAVISDYSHRLISFIDSALEQEDNKYKRELAKQKRQRASQEAGR